MGTFDPRIAFGLKAMTLALKARCGVATQKMAATLQNDCIDMVGGDPVAARAAADFARDLDLDQATAGAALLEFCARWPDASSADLGVKTERVLVEAETGFYDWQNRKDCGHD